MILIKKGLFRFDGDRAGNFCRDIAVSSMVSVHKNFLKLVGCCLEFEGPVTVYHGVKKHYKLDDISKQPWKMRMKIAEDIATALAYLHTSFPRPFIYRTFSYENILFDEDGVAKLSDFSCCVSILEGETFVKVDSPVGSYRYMEYKCMENGVVSEKTDIYAFRMLMMLKLLIGKERFWEISEGEKAKEEVEGEAEGEDYNYDSDDTGVFVWKMTYPVRHLQRWLSKFKEKRRMDEIADLKMLENMGGVSEIELCQIKAFEKLSSCVEVVTMVEVAKELKKIQKSLINDSSSPSDETRFEFFDERLDKPLSAYLRRRKKTVDKSFVRETAEREEEVE